MPEQTPIPASVPEPAPAMGPVRAKERIEVLDILRGWAIFGMVLVNMSHDLPWNYLFEKLCTGTADHAAVHLIRFFASDKFWTLFSFLFGLGFALQLGRAEARDVRFFPLYRRRLLVLLLIGLVHQWLGPFDILRVYALLGFLLLLFRARSPRTILLVALICFLIPRVHGAIVTGIHELRLADPQTAQEVIRQDAQRAAERRARNEQDLRVHSRGSFGEIMAHRVQGLAWPLPSRPSLRASLRWTLGGLFPLLLLGLYAGRRRIFENLPAHLPFIRKVMWWGLGLGLVGMSVNFVLGHLLTNPAWPYLTSQLRSLLWDVGAPALCFFYASAIILLVQRAAWKKRLAPLAAVGRLALSNYLFHGLPYLIIFYSYGLGLYGKVGPLGGLALAIFIFPLQVLLSIWWVGRFRFGPAEWLWRTLTYGKLQPMRVRQIAA